MGGDVRYAFSWMLYKPRMNQHSRRRSFPPAASQRESCSFSRAVPLGETFSWHPTSGQAPGVKGIPQGHLSQPSKGTTAPHRSVLRRHFPRLTHTMSLRTNLCHTDSSPSFVPGMLRLQSKKRKNSAAGLCTATERLPWACEVTDDQNHLETFKERELRGSPWSS